MQLGKLIVREQEKFLRNGIAGLKSYTMREAGNQLKYDESTISRAVADKYIRTPQGVFPLRFFFSSGGGSGGDGAKIASAAIMAQIKQIIDREDPADPESDERIASILAEQGISVARRTVAKYRDAMNIPGASIRKRR